MKYILHCGHYTLHGLNLKRGHWLSASTYYNRYKNANQLVNPKNHNNSEFISGVNYMQGQTEYFCSLKYFFVLSDIVEFIDLPKAKFNKLP